MEFQTLKLFVCRDRCLSAKVYSGGLLCAFTLSGSSELLIALVITAAAVLRKGVAGPDSVTGGRGEGGVRSGRKWLTVLHGFELLRCSSNAPSAVFVTKRGKTLNFRSK